MLGQNGNSSKDIVVTNVTKTAEKPEKPVWQEVKSDDGNSYYWNTQTNGNFFYNTIYILFTIVYLLLITKINIVICFLQVWYIIKF